MPTLSKPWWQQVTALVSLSAGGAITGLSFVPRAAADMKSPSSVPIHLLALKQSAQPAPADDATLRSAVVNVANYYLRMAAGKTPAEVEAIIWQHDSVDGVDHGASCAAFASLTLELAAQVVGQQSWVTGGTSYPWPLHTWADVRVDPNPASPGITSVLQDAQTHDRWHPLGDGYEPLPGDWVLFNGHVEVVTHYAGGVLYTVGGDSLPDFSVNAHEYPDPLGTQGVIGFVNNGELAVTASPAPRGQAPRSPAPGAGDRVVPGQVPPQRPPQVEQALTAIPGAPAAASGELPPAQPPGGAAIPGMPVAEPTASASPGASPSPSPSRGPSRSASLGPNPSPSLRPSASTSPSPTVSASTSPSPTSASTSPSARPSLRPTVSASPSASARPSLHPSASASPSASLRRSGSAAASASASEAGQRVGRPARQASGVIPAQDQGAPGQAVVAGVPGPGFAAAAGDAPDGRAGSGSHPWTARDPGAPAASPTASPGPKQAFVANIAPAAMAAQQKYGVPASVTIAQAIEESGWGQSSLATKDHNLFGIKGSGPAGSDPLATEEYENGQSVTRIALFRVYHDVTESIDDHGKLLATSGYYTQAMADRQNPNAFAAALTGVYATDPNYGAKLINIMQRYNLYRYDTPAPAASSPATADGASTARVAPTPPLGTSRPAPSPTATPGPATMSGAYQSLPKPAPSIRTVSARRVPTPVSRQTRRNAASLAPGSRGLYKQRIPPSVRNAFTTMAKVRLVRAEPLYRDVASHSGIRWELLAACDWMQCAAQPRYSPVHGEKLGTVNPDGTIYRTKSEALEQCADDLVELAWAVYGIDLTARDNHSVRDLANVFAAFRWGGLLKLHHTSAMEFPYSVAGLTDEHVNMRWPKIDEPNTPDKPGKRFRMPFGALPIVLGLDYEATV